MCGIAGAIARLGRVDAEALARMRDRLVHRGPDDAGLWLSPDRRVGLAHRRLAVLDLSPAGHQPMHAANGRFTLVFNGEIYNFRALRAELEALGHGFTSRSDTEVLLAAWGQWGENCLPRLNGMFAFALHDAGGADAPERLWLVRDRVGKKPVYWREGAAGIEFASELKALPGPHTISTAALNQYLALGYVLGEDCIAADVRRLAPGHLASIDARTLAVRVRSWWSLPAAGEDCGLSLTEAAERAGSLLEDSVRLRLESDVPVGVLLSGGLDSSLVAAAAARAGARLRTFTIALPGSSLDEADAAARIAHHFGAEHHALSLAEPSLAVLDEIAPSIDEPIADSSLIPAWLVSRLARAHVTVALGGDGGDELFGGYNDYAQVLTDERRLRAIPQLALSMIAGAAAVLPAGVRGRNRLLSLQRGPALANVWGTPYFDVALRRRILEREAWTALAHDTAHAGGLAAPETAIAGLFAAGHDTIDAMTRTHFGSILPDDFMFKVDRASMAHALEMRSPLLDWRLVEFAFGELPSRLKVGPSGSRLVQRELARRWLPPAADFSRKQGFSIPIDQWLRSDGERLFEQWSPHLPEAIHRPAVRSLLDGLARGRANGARLYALLMLAIAHRNLRAAPAGDTIAAG
jgi:asparagine synthase (glutamine-hydrolysing)